MTARVRLHYRIVIPFTLVALVTAATTAYVSLRVTESALQSRVDAQILSAASLIAQGEFALNPVILSSVKAIAGADVVTFTAAGAVVTSTLDPAQSERNIAGIRTAEGFDAGASQRGVVAPVLLRQIECGGRCDAAYRRLPSRPDTFV